ERAERTELGYRRFRCGTCQQGFNERTGTLFNRLQYPTDVVCLVVLWRMRYKLSLRDLAEMFLDRGIVFIHEVVREWEAKLAPVLSEPLRRHRRSRIGRSWYCDETYLKVKGRWVYLYRGIDRDGNLVMGSIAAQSQCGERERRAIASTSLTSPALTALRRAKSSSSWI